MEKMFVTTHLLMIICAAGIVCTGLIDKKVTKDAESQNRPYFKHLKGRIELIDSINNS